MRTDQEGVEKKKRVYLIKWQFLYFFSLPQGQGDLRETDGDFVPSVTTPALPRFARGALKKEKRAPTVNTGTLTNRL